MADLAINLLASIIAGVAVWTFSRLRRRQRTERMRAFFGVRPGSEALFVVARHHSSPEELSVHREDAGALIELAAVVLSCGGRANLVAFDRVPPSRGTVPEFCVGGPVSNERTAAHLQLLLPGVRVDRSPGTNRGLHLGDRRVTWDSAEGDDAPVYVLLAKMPSPSPSSAPVFLVCGLSARSNRAAAHHLAVNHRTLARQYGTGGRFALLLTLRGLLNYGNDALLEVEDVTDEAFTAPTGA